MAKLKYRFTLTVEKIKELAAQHYTIFDNGNVCAKIQLEKGVDVELIEMDKLIEEAIKNIPFNPKTVN